MNWLQMQRWAARLRSFFLKTIAAGVVSFVATWIIHAEFHSSLTLTYGLVGVGFVVWLTGDVLEHRPRPPRFARWTRRSGQVLLLAGPFVLLASLGVMRLDLWITKRYVRQELAPMLERVRAQRGAYPPSLELRRLEDAPFLMSHATYRRKSEQAYQISIWSPTACGIFWTYESDSRKWVETYDPCMF